MTVILDNGHGHTVNGVYQTEGKRSPDLGKGVLYEGVFNRWISNKVQYILDRERIPYYHISPEHRDVGLQTRVNRANAIYAKDKNVYVLSLHANAGGGTGLEIWTSEGQTKSDDIATEFFIGFQTLSEMPQRADYWSDGDPDKERNFYILKHTYCPAVLLEAGFMDYKDDYDLLFSEDYQNKYAFCVADAIKSLYVR